ncbi:hyalin, partial [Candidatus Endoriftia persephone str. Guaymas]|nr:hyalin [Candidatus Endoriftia persephone str. Guaymas]
QSRTVSVTDQTAPQITLNGDNPQSVEAGSSYSDPGAVASDNVDGDLSSSVAVSGSVNASVLGSYTLTYNVSDAAGNAATAVTRAVNVVDQTAPVITLLGCDPMSVEGGATFSDPGATASDSFEGDLSAGIVISGSVDSAVLGSYTLTYNVSDSTGNAATAVTRRVNVVDQTAPVITLIGANPLEVALGSSFTDPGASASDAVDGDLSTSITVAGTVDTNTLGSYTLTYSVSDAEGNAATPVQRSVLVTDQIAPVITLIGANPQAVEAGSTYGDPGASASDNVDGDLSASISVSGSVDTAVP